MIYKFEKFDTYSQEKKNLILNRINKKLETYSAKKRIEWAVKHLPKNFILSSSFGVQSAVSLHLITQKIPDIPIVLVDTGYLFPETYLFIEKLTKKFKLNLKIFRSIKSPAWQEAKYGQLWKKGLEGIQKYNQINKVKPMQYAFKKLKCKTWFSGLRKVQSITRSKLSILSIQNGLFKFLPIIDWNNQKIHFYLKNNDLEYHPLWKKGYVSIGDIHTTEKLKSGMTEEQTRFFGLHRECGIHEEKHNLKK